MMLTRRTLLQALPLLLLVPRRARAHPLMPLQPSSHPLNSPASCAGWWLAAPGQSSRRWGDLLHGAPLVWAGMSGAVTTTSGVAASTTRRGGFGEVRCDGSDDYGSVSHHARLNLTTDFALSVWLRVTSLSSYNGVLAKVAGDDTLYDYELVVDNATINFYSDTTGSIVADRLLPDTGWHHVVVSRAGGFLTITVDTRPATPVASAASLPTRTFPLLLGTDYNATAPSYQYFAGMLDDVRVYRRGLTLAEITLLWADPQQGYPQLLTRQDDALLPAVAATTSFRRKSRLW